MSPRVHEFADVVLHDEERTMPGPGLEEPGYGHGV
jgi:hypothetical protein